jgi:hypothetical protein
MWHDLCRYPKNRRVTCVQSYSVAKMLRRPVAFGMHNGLSTHLREEVRTRRIRTSYYSHVFDRHGQYRAEIMNSS